MRSSKSRSRNKSNRQRTIGNIINRVFDSSGPESKVRGTPQQIIEKYLGLARDAQLGNDRVAEQNFLQHAEHYTRMLGEAQREIAREQEERQRSFQQNGNAQNGNTQNANAQNGNPQNAGGQNAGGQNGGQNGNRDRQDRNDREPEPPRYEAPRFDSNDAIGDALATDDSTADLVETPEMRSDPQPAVVPASVTPAPAQTPAPVISERPAREPSARKHVTPDAEAEPAAAEGEAAAPPRAPRAPRRAPRKPRAPKAAADSAELPLNTPSDASGE
ncbi:MAG TPA: DUF4167 domain-containing protein [Paenirhodobacter sp.]